MFAAGMSVGVPISCRLPTEGRQLHENCEWYRECNNSACQNSQAILLSKWVLDNALSWWWMPCLPRKDCIQTPVLLHASERQVEALDWQWSFVLSGVWLVPETSKSKPWTRFPRQRCVQKHQSYGQPPSRGRDWIEPNHFVIFVEVVIDGASLLYSHCWLDTIQVWCVLWSRQLSCSPTLRPCDLLPSGSPIGSSGFAYLWLWLERWYHRWVHVHTYIYVLYSNNISRIR